MKTITILSICLCFVVFAGCSYTNKKSKNQSTQPVSVNQSLGNGAVPEPTINNVYPLAAVKVSDVEWITKKDNFPAFRCWSVLFPEKDLNVITKSETETSSTTYKDRFIIIDKTDNSTSYYTAYFSEVAEYILSTSNPDFKEVKQFDVSLEDFKYGEKVTVSGDGCTEKEVNILLENGNDAEKEEYIIGKQFPKR